MMIKEDMQKEKENKTYTGKDLMEAAKNMLKNDAVGSKLSDAALEKLSKLLTKTALKGDL